MRKRGDSIPVQVSGWGLFTKFKVGSLCEKWERR
jgi:hypothetical protein